jgi:hypothetical protein
MINVSNFTSIQYAGHEGLITDGLTVSPLLRRIFSANQIGLRSLQKYVFSVLLFPFHRYK